jgi:hypothetical protein
MKNQGLACLLVLMCLLGCDARQRIQCESEETQCMDTCKDHVTTTTLVDLSGNQSGKVECLRFCYSQYDRCMGVSVRDGKRP